MFPVKNSEEVMLHVIMTQQKRTQFTTKMFKLKLLVLTNSVLCGFIDSREKRNVGPRYKH